MQKIGTYSHKIYNYHSNDFQGQVTLDRLVNIILDSAGIHAEDNGFGKEFILDRGCTWVLSRLNIVLHQPPQSLDNVLVSTWIREVRSAFSIRVFQVRDKHENLIASATTLWSVIDFSTRKIVPIYNIIAKDEMICEQEVDADFPQKLIFERGETQTHEIAQYTDLDFNCHVNSNRYVQWALNSFSLDFWKQHYLQQIEINFNHEVYYADKVTVLGNCNEKYSEIELYNNTQELTACRLRLHSVYKSEG